MATTSATTPPSISAAFPDYVDPMDESAVDDTSNETPLSTIPRRTRRRSRSLSDYKIHEFQTRLRPLEPFTNRKLKDGTLLPKMGSPSFTMPVGTAGRYRDMASPFMDATQRRGTWILYNHSAPQASVWPTPIATPSESLGQDVQSVQSPPDPQDHLPASKPRTQYAILGQQDENTLPVLILQNPPPPPRKRRSTVSIPRVGQNDEVVRIVITGSSPTATIILPSVLGLGTDEIEKPLTRLEAALGIAHTARLCINQQEPSTEIVQTVHLTGILTKKQNENKEQNKQKLWIVSDENNENWIKQHLTSAQLKNFNLVTQEEFYDSISVNGVGSARTAPLASKIRRKDRGKTFRPRLDHRSKADGVYEAIINGAPRYSNGHRSAPLICFWLFKHLPIEVQQNIWKILIPERFEVEIETRDDPEGSNIDLFGPTTVLHPLLGVCKATRALVLKITGISLQHSALGGPTFYNPEKDTLLMGPFCAADLAMAIDDQLVACRSSVCYGQIASTIVRTRKYLRAVSTMILFAPLEKWLGIQTWNFPGAKHSVEPEIWVLIEVQRPKSRFEALGRVGELKEYVLQQINAAEATVMGGGRSATVGLKFIYVDTIAGGDADGEQD